MVKKTETHNGGWQKLALYVVGALVGILTFFVQEIYRDTSKIDVMQNQIETLSTNKEWMKSMQKEIKALQKEVWKSHPGH